MVKSVQTATATVTVVACEANIEGNCYDVLLSNGETKQTKGSYTPGVAWISPEDLDKAIAQENEQARAQALENPVTEVVGLKFDADDPGYVVIESRIANQPETTGHARWALATGFAIVGQVMKIDFAYDTDAKTVSVLIDDVERMNAPLPVLDKALDDNAMLQRGLDEANAAMASLSAQNGRMAEEILNLKANQGQAPIPASLTSVQTRDVADLPRLDQLQSLKPMDPPAEQVDTRTDVEKHIAAKAAAREIEKPISEEEAKHNELEGAKS